MLTASRPSDSAIWSVVSRISARVIGIAEGERTVRCIYTAYMALDLLLTDGTGLTSRQVATQAAAAGHHVDVLAPTRLGPASFTRHVRRVRRVPAFGREPEAWLEACLDVLRGGVYDVLVPTQEQVAILARDAARLPVACPVPSFEALGRVQDKVAQARTLATLGLPHPATV